MYRFWDVLARARLTGRIPMGGDAVVAAKVSGQVYSDVPLHRAKEVPGVKMFW